MSHTDRHIHEPSRMPKQQLKPTFHYFPKTRPIRQRQTNPLNVSKAFVFEVSMRAKVQIRGHAFSKGFRNHPHPKATRAGAFDECPSQFINARLLPLYPQGRCPGLSTLGPNRFDFLTSLGGRENEKQESQVDL